MECFLIRIVACGTQRLSSNRVVGYAVSLVMDRRVRETEEERIDGERTKRTSENAYLQQFSIIV